ncbi:MAG: ABC transporter substrate-binding protein, partial [Rhodomicrobium sp.]
VKPEQTGVVAQPYLRAWKDLNSVDLASYQAFVDVFRTEGVLKQDFDVKPFILKASDIAV